jgi:hypothetical protein
MARSFPPPPWQTVETALGLLSRVPKTWAAVPELSHLESQGLGLLVNCGLVERRLSLRLRAAGDKRAVDMSFRFTGQNGLAQAVEPALAEAWALCEAAWKAGQKVYVEWPDRAEGEWRLTDQGETAAHEAAGGDVEYLRDFLRTPGVPGTDRLPARFIPGQYRPVVDGEGHMKRVTVLDTDKTPLHVHVDNLEEVTAPLGEIARVVEGVLQHWIDGAA